MIDLAAERKAFLAREAPRKRRRMAQALFRQLGLNASPGEIQAAVRERWGLDEKEASRADQKNQENP